MSDGADPRAVRPATRTDRAAIVRVFSAAFYDDPLMRWVFPHTGRRAGALRRLYAMEVDTYLENGLVFVTATRDAAATWLAPGQKESLRPRTALRHLPAFVAAAGPLRAIQALRTFSLSEGKKPTEPHYYLGTVGVASSAQGQGLGSALLAAVLPRIDDEAMPTYLLSSNASNVPLYERFGFRVLEEVQLPRGGPPLWPMYRDAVR